MFDLPRHFAAPARLPPPAGAPGSASVPVDIAHKAVVLRCLQAQCEDGQLLVDLFVNYDCDLEGANLFERMVTALVRIAQGSLSHEGGGGAQTPLEEQAIRYEVGGTAAGLAARWMGLEIRDSVVALHGSQRPNAWSSPHCATT